MGKQKSKKERKYGKAQDRVADVGLTDRLLDVTIYIYVGSVLEK